MLDFNADKVRANVEKAETEDLLDRATVYRGGMEPEALPLIDAELRKRGVTAAQVHDHAERRSREGVRWQDGKVARRCSRCDRPAVHGGWGWHWMWGRVPLFPRWLYWCAEHRPKPVSPSAPAHPPPPG